MSNEQPATIHSSPEALVLALKDEIKTKVADSKDSVRAKVISSLADAEIKRRVDLLTSALAKRDEKAKEVDSIRADICAYDMNGKPVSENWSKPQLKKRAAALKQLAKIDRAITKAINEANFDEVKKVASGTIEPDKDDDGEENETGS